MERDELLDTLRAEAARLREALETLNHAAKFAISREYGSSFDEETPLVIRLLDGTCDATDEALASTPTTAEWLAARDEEQRRLGAADELERLAENTEELREMFLSQESMGLRAFSHGKLNDGLKARAAQLRKGE